MAGLVLSPFAAQQRILQFVNKSGDRVPPHAAVKLKRSRAAKSHLGYKPDKDDDPFVVFNGQFEVEPEGEGYATVDYPLWAKYNAADGDPANGESLGTRASFWELHRGYEGFLVWGGADGEKVFVQSDVTCREAGGDQYYYYDGYGTTPARRASGLACCGAGGTYPTLTVTISGGSVWDGVYPLTWQYSQLVQRGHDGSCAPNNYVYKNGLFSDWFPNPNASCNPATDLAPYIRHRIFLEETIADTQVACIVQHTTEYTYYEIGGGGCTGTIDQFYGSLNTGMATITSVCSPLLLLYRGGVLSDCNFGTATTDVMITE